MHIENQSPDEIVKLEIPTGVPRIYEYDSGKFQRIN